MMVELVLGLVAMVMMGVGVVISLGSGFLLISIGLNLFGYGVLLIALVAILAELRRTRTARTRRPPTP